MRRLHRDDLLCPIRKSKTAEPEQDPAEQIEKCLF